MPSPFPGMDPYLEQHWRDVHTRLIVYAGNHLQPRLPSDLRARVEERVLVESPAAEIRGVFPDVRIFDTGRGASQAAPAAAGTATEPLLLEVMDEPRVETFIEIRETGTGHRLVTAIEVLSLANKCPGQGHQKYVLKQAEYIRAGVNLVEVDLLRSGMRVAAAPIELLPPNRPSNYLVSVWRAARPSRYEAYPIGLRDRLPTIRVPLRASDSDVHLDLQALIDECWKTGGYDDTDYSVPPVPELSPDDDAWARTLVRPR